MSLKNILDFRNKYFVLLQLQRFKAPAYFKDHKVEPNKKHAFIFLAADYGNLGDVAITYAQTKFLKDNLGNDFQVIEIPISQSLEGLHFVKKNIKSGDIVTSVGGGNMGDMYDQIEYIRQLAVHSFPKNKFISFPQTFDFSDTVQGNKALAVAKRLYNAHPDLYMVAREKTSYGLMKAHFNKAKVLLTPDIVISLNKEQPVRERKGAVICLRADKEKNLTEEQFNFIHSQIKNRFDAVRFNDTHIDRDQLSISERETELEKIWNTFKTAELVITDRLHGMIFCYITNTPCLVFQNNNHKVRETYDWIKENKNINLVTEYSEERIKEFMAQNKFNIGEIPELSSNYKPLIKALKYI
ncbi:polysaccharide pyruvyl transferase family protein [Aequorivita marina]|uniref:polysaccharide pyruvyl transferase family protein n=1 Tax=Aequorivita marina TaxID=3073654 RepID=UPI002876D17C|nr:polysaccharide pyruvyl transferase family protein [Aequorivita sp. S2608]MDS1299089.1 polysaccharide pyruvyl transferase family protein [Aequorivita sp. S2608]